MLLYVDDVRGLTGIFGRSCVRWTVFRPAAAVELVADGHVRARVDLHGMLHRRVLYLPGLVSFETSRSRS